MLVEQSIEKMERVQAALDFTKMHKVPTPLMNEVLRWTRFCHQHTAVDLRNKSFLDTLPMELKRKIVTNIFGESLSKVPLFRLLQAEDESFLVEVSCLCLQIYINPRVTPDCDPDTTIMRIPVMRIRIAILFDLAYMMMGTTLGKYTSRTHHTLTLHSLRTNPKPLTNPPSHPPSHLHPRAFAHRSSYIQPCHPYL